MAKKRDYASHISDVQGWERIPQVFLEKNKIIFKEKITRLESSLIFNEDAKSENSRPLDLWANKMLIENLSD